MTDEYRERVRKLAADVLGEPLERISDDSSPDNIEAWDSLQHLNLILSVEEAFDLQLDPEDIEKATSIGELVNLVTLRMDQAP